MLAVAVVFVILLVATNSVRYYRGSFSVEGVETQGEAPGRSPALGAAAGVAVLVLLGLLYTGVTQWDWFGRPAPRDTSVAAPAR